MSDSGWGAVISGIAAIYSQKKKKDAAEDQYKFQQDELERRNQYNRERYEAAQNSPGAKAQKYLMAYYLPQVVEKMKNKSRGGDTSILDRMLQDIMGGLDVDGSSGSGGGSSQFSESDGIMTQVGGSRRAGVNPQVAGAARKEGNYTLSAGKVDPEIDGYTGKGWENRQGAGMAGLLGSATYGGGDTDWGTSASQVGGQRESTRNMGNTTTQTERGYTVQQMPWNMIDEGADQAFPNQQGELATGGTLNVATDGMDPGKIMAVGAMLGITKGPKGTTMGPNGTYGDGNFQMSDVMDWARAHPTIWSILKGLGNVVVPGLPTIAQAGLNANDRRVARRQQQANG